MQSQEYISQSGYRFIVFNLFLGELLLIFDPDLLTGFLREDSVAESLGALFLLLTSLALLLAAKRHFQCPVEKERDFWLRFITLVVAGAAFFWAAGEEISWGQRIFNLSTPDALKAVNQQKELNLHNLNTRFFNNALETIILLAIVIPVVFRLRNRDRLLGFALPSFSLVLGFQLIACYVTYHYMKPQDYLAYLVLPRLLIFFLKIQDRKKVLMVCLNIVLVIIIAKVNIDFQGNFPGNGPREFREYLFSFLCFIYGLEILFDEKSGWEYGSEREGKIIKKRPRQRKVLSS